MESVSDTAQKFEEWADSMKDAGYPFPLELAKIQAVKGIAPDYKYSDTRIAATVFEAAYSMGVIDGLEHAAHYVMNEVVSLRFRNRRTPRTDSKGESKGGK